MTPRSVSLKTSLKKLAGNALVLALLAAVVAPSASAYYHWVFYAGRDGAFVPIRMKFDLNALAGNRVPFFISRDQPSPMVEGDSFDALVSQIRLAADTWNEVPTSALKLEFGGLGTIGDRQTAPGIDVVFDDEMPPGVLAQTRPETHSDLAYLAVEGAPDFAPILRSRLQLRKDLTTFNQASFSDAFFLTIAHEFGHTLGLQHSLTSAVMSTSVTRATTKALPLSADDWAGLSLLYPTEEFRRSTGSLAGTVRVDGRPAGLVSVVALALDGTVVSSLSHPDGSYRIDGVPPGDYYVYAHPLPPAQQDEGLPAGLQLPRDLSGEAFAPDTGFATAFYPGTRRWQDAARLSVAAGAEVGAIDFQLEPRSGPAVYAMRVFAYFGESGSEVAVHAPRLVSGDYRYLVLHAPGTVVPGTTDLTPGLHMEVIGGAGQGAEGPNAFVTPETLQYWDDQDNFLLLAAGAGAVDRPTPAALAVTTGDDLYVLPAAFTVVPQGPPQISSVSGYSDPQGNPFARIEGTNLHESTRILFDGAAGDIVEAAGDGTSLVVAAPPATGAHRAALQALDGSGQTSTRLLAGASPPRFDYREPERPSVTVTPGDVTAGTDVVLQIDGADTTFLDRETVAGFGLSDIAVRQVWVTNRNRMLVNVSVGAGAKTGPTAVTVASGLQLVSLDTVLLVHPPDGVPLSLHAPVTNLETGLAGVPAGGKARIAVSGLPEDLSGWSLTVGGAQTLFTREEGGRALYARIPGDVQQGPVPVQLIGPGGGQSPPVLMQVDAPPPVIQQVTVNGAGGASSWQAVGASNPLRAGQVIRLIVAGLADGYRSYATDQIRIHVGAAVFRASSVIALRQGVSQVEFQLTGPDAGLAMAVSAEASGEQALRIQVGTRISPALLLSVAAPASE